VKIKKDTPMSPVLMREILAIIAVMIAFNEPIHTPEHNTENTEKEPTRTS
jgi:hypothetical protein